ncbi:hypothetical protein GCM10022254_05870 [Actinomadura meridiana]|uniref:Uncharacterized protein n=1 Tax=Actinomadura meridiana TaxID=559626 RepID=A0ABP8BSN9_9ACTN
MAAARPPTEIPAPRQIITNRNHPAIDRQGCPALHRAALVVSVRTEGFVMLEMLVAGPLPA